MGQSVETRPEHREAPRVWTRIFRSCFHATEAAQEAIRELVSDLRRSTSGPGRSGGNPQARWRANLKEQVRCASTLSRAPVEDLTRSSAACLPARAGGHEQRSAHTPGRPRLPCRSWQAGRARLELTGRRRRGWLRPATRLTFAESHFGAAASSRSVSRPRGGPSDGTGSGSRRRDDRPRAGSGPHER